MDIKQKPAVWNVIWAQGVSYLLVVILTTILIAVLFFLALTTVPAWYLMIVFPFSGMILARLQRRMLRQWIPQTRNFLLASACGLLVVLFMEYFITRFIIDERLVNQLTTFGGDTAWHIVQPAITRWSLLSGFLAGVPGGLVFGLIQSFFIPWRRRLWVGISALVWGFIGAIFLVVVNVLIFIIYLALPHAGL